MVTTIVYKDGILAADTRIVWGNIAGYCRKLHAIDDCVYAIAGDLPSEERALEYLRGRIIKEPKRLPKFEAFKIQDGKVWWAQNSLYWNPLEQRFYALGSGWQIAMAAMHLGIGAVNAIMLAGDLDINTNKLVDSYNIKTKRFKKAIFPEPYV